ncbi:carotenoid oxygenase family protein [Prochlorothrix hollandica]|uniref:Apocarotenoid-15,15'-oxygenase n=1 Tax=Prochlorothrix hollandica PCC 9006 = CALU 1027 TaxID=317619 RepID=A0A0M2Q4L6_PROHO|nr:carotenoid oxygenase family protein [Prochlorothrix hollandica]KKJ01527.1 Apocarotenoid-15,15'-oxygenase [Prochlorothrix hollandica PCC 9006 = CALU 1027]
MQTLDPASHQSSNLSSNLSYSREDWRRGYQSQPQESSYWITEMEGTLPPDLQGTLFRNGPGLMDVKGQRIHHPFDGDGLIAQITFAEGRAHFRSRYVRTDGYVAEQKAGRILYRGVFGTQKPGGWLANFLDTRFKNIANTNVIYWGGKLLALWEAAEPHGLDPHTLETLGLDRLQGTLPAGAAFSAHPRVDPGSPHSGGEPRLVNFGVKAGLSSSITLYEFNPQGDLVQQQTRDIPGFAFLHDFALTPHYAVFFQNPMRLNPLPFALGLKGAGQCLEFQGDRPTQALIIPRDPQMPMQTIDLPACFVFHHANAYEETDESGNRTVVVDSICYDFFPTVEPDADFLEVDFDLYPPGKLWRCELDLARNTAQRTCLSDRPCEFPSQNPSTVGQKTRYYYIATAHNVEGNSPLQAVIKVDLSTGTSQIHSFAPRGFMGEPLFVPRPGATAEDDGWVLVLTYRADRHQSALAILQGQTLEPVATLYLQEHIPYGLHGTFTPAVLGLPTTA